MMSAGALIFDPHENILLVRDFKRNVWSWPGGGAKNNETPLVTCRREVLEETGLELVTPRLISVRTETFEGSDGKLIFLFADYLSDKALQNVRIQPDEIAEWRLVDIETARILMAEPLRIRFEHILAALNEKSVAYIEQGQRSA